MNTTVFEMATSFLPAKTSTLFFAFFFDFWAHSALILCIFCALYDACSVANIPRGVLGTRVNLDHLDKIRMIRVSVGYLWTSKLDLNTDTCGRGNL